MFSVRDLLNLCLLLCTVSRSTSFSNPWISLRANHCPQESKVGYVTSPRTCRDTRMALQQDASTADSFTISNVLLTDMYCVIRLANAQFLTNSDTIVDIIKLDAAVLRLFLPKLLFPEAMKHSVIGVRSISNNSLVGFVDLSLQTSSGSLDALKPMTFNERKRMYGEKLAPYLCNLFVSPTLRKKGLARKLIAACEAEARKWGFNTINLHVELTSSPAINLYTSTNFNTVTVVGEVAFMCKKIIVE